MSTEQFAQYLALVCRGVVLDLYGIFGQERPKG